MLGHFLIDVRQLENETIDQSFENLLTNGNQYNILLGYNQSTLELILSSRRAVKVLDTLRTMRTPKRVEKCRELFQRAMQVEGEVYDAIFRAREEPGFPAPSRLIPKNAIGVAMLATAETGRRDILAEQIREIEEFRAYVLDRMTEHGSLYSELEARVIYKFCIPDSRLQINALRLVALKGSAANDLVERVDTYLESKGLIRSNLLVTAWNARTTAFETPMGIRPDTTKGAINFEFYQWPGTESGPGEDFEFQVLEEAKSMVLPAIPDSE